LLESQPNVRALIPHFAAGMFALDFRYFGPPFGPFSHFRRRVTKYI
jgi:hypothetical protein